MHARRPSVLADVLLVVALDLLRRDVHLVADLLVDERRALDVGAHLHPVLLPGEPLLRERLFELRFGQVVALANRLDVGVDLLIARLDAQRLDLLLHDPVEDQLVEEGALIGRGRGVGGGAPPHLLTEALQLEQRHRLTVDGGDDAVHGLRVRRRGGERRRTHRTQRSGDEHSHDPGHLIHSNLPQNVLSSAIIPSVSRSVGR